MKLGGVQKFSLIDYPGTLCAVAFCQGCNLRCSFCHNPQLVYPDLFDAARSHDDFFSFLEERVGKLEGVVISGGEPTIHADLPDFAVE